MRANRLRPRATIQAGRKLDVGLRSRRLAVSANTQASRSGFPDSRASTLPWFGVEIMTSAATSWAYGIVAPLRSWPKPWM